MNNIIERIMHRNPNAHHMERTIKFVTEQEQYNNHQKRLKEQRLHDEKLRSATSRVVNEYQATQTPAERPPAKDK